MHPDSDKASSPSSSSSSSSAFSRLVFGPGGAATLSGFCEIMIFHPLDTIAKRLMAHQARVVVPGSLSQTLENVDLVLFKSLKKTSSSFPPHSTGASAAAAGVHPPAAHAKHYYESIPFTRRVQHLYPGSAWAVSYKVCQRFIKFAGQPYAKDYLEHHRDRLPLLARHHNASSLPMSEWPEKEQTREKRKKMALEATAGCLVGVSEVVLLPLDRMKVLSQTNPESLPWHRRAGSSSASSAAAVGASSSSSSWLSFVRSLYSGATVTAVRNAPGSFLLFGGAAFTKEYVFHLQDYRKATFAQNVVASTVGAMLGVLFTSPMDVIKTRIQSRGLSERPGTAMGTVAALLKQEGPSAFYKGIVPKLAATAPRLVFSYTMTQYWTAVLRRMQ